MSQRRGALAVGLPLVLLVLLLAAGCRSTPPITDFTAGTPLAIDDERAERALGSYLALSESRPALRGLARVVLQGPDFKLNRPQRIAVERPARLRFEVLGLFDQLAALLVTRGRDFGFFDAGSGEITRGRLTPRLLWDLARIDLDPHEIVGILLGTPTPSPGTARAAVWLEPDGSVAVAFAWPDTPAGRPPECDVDVSRASFDAVCFLSLAALGEGGEVFSFDADGRLVELRVLEPGGSTRYRARFEDYEQIEEIRADEAGARTGEFAHRVTIHSPELHAEARFSWKRVMLAGELSDRFFEIPERDQTGQGG